MADLGWRSETARYEFKSVFEISEAFHRPFHVGPWPPVIFSLPGSFIY